MVKELEVFRPDGVKLNFKEGEMVVPGKILKNFHIDHENGIADISLFDTEGHLALVIAGMPYIVTYHQN